MTVIALFVNTSLSAQQWTTQGNDIHNNNPGRVGIGTVNPQTKIHVGGTTSDEISIGATSYGGNSGQALATLQSSEYANGAGGGLLFKTLQWNGAWSPTEKMRIAENGRVGIGTTTPQTRFHVGGTTSDEISIGTTGYGGNSGQALATLQSAEYANGAGGGLVFKTLQWSGAWAPTEKMRIDENGNVGIGIADPQTKLHVAGNVTATNFSATYQDLAEWVPASLEVSPGMVVIIDPGSDNSVIPSAEAYDTRVAGVVSENPGIVLGEAGPQKARIATTGRVKVRVEATNNPIEIGDLLVTSSVAGTAMKSKPVDVAGVKMHRPGTLIGKALERLKEGEGEILVLLSLQ